MRAVYWSCMAIVSIAIADAVGCGGRVMVAECGDGRQYCSESNVCCPSFTLCGDGKNGCPPGDCCLNTTSHVVDGGTDATDGALAPVELPPPDMGPGSGGPTSPTPGGFPGGGAGGGGSNAPPVGGYTRS